AGADLPRPARAAGGRLGVPAGGGGAGGHRVDGAPRRGGAGDGPAGGGPRRGAPRCAGPAPGGGGGGGFPPRPRAPGAKRGPSSWGRQTSSGSRPSGRLW